MKRKSIIRVSAASAAAVISGVILYETVIARNLLGEMGLVGMFLASMLSHLTVIGRGLFGPSFLLLTSLYQPMVLGAFTGWGGAIGEVTTYYLGLGIREAVEEEEKDGFRRWVDRYGLLVVLFLAATPLPDTPIVLLAGSNRFPISKILLAEGVGKTIFYSLGAVFGGFLFMGLTGAIGNLWASVMVVLASAVFSIILSWEKTRSRIFRRKNQKAS